MAKRVVCPVCFKHTLPYLQGVTLYTADGNYWYPSNCCKACALVLMAMVEARELTVEGHVVEQLGFIPST